MRRLWFVLISAAVLVGVVMVFGGEKEGSLKIGFVDLAKATDSYYKMKELNAEYKKDLQFYQEKLKKLEDELQELKNSGASQEEIKKKESELMQKRQLFQGLLQQEYQPKIQQIFQEVVQKAKEYAQIANYDLIITNQGAVYASERMDITDQFIEYLNSSSGEK